MHTVVVDCDNTMGLADCDIDDALALFYLLGRDDVELLGITTTFGNSSTILVYQNTLRMFEELKIKEIPVLRGADSGTDRQSDASDFLAVSARKHPKRLTLLATGSLTNLYAAYRLDQGFFDRLERIVLMGGITQPLTLNGKPMDELNLSCDPEASYEVLNSGADITVITGNLCLEALFDENRIKSITDNPDVPLFRHMKRDVINWHRSFREGFGINGFYVWDAVAAVFITNPELFEGMQKQIVSSKQDLETGTLKTADPIQEDPLMQGVNPKSIRTVNIPERITDISKFWELVMRAWGNVKIGV